MKRPIAFNYLDYRTYLKDLFAFRKQQDSFFSYRYFSGKAGFASPNFLKLVIENQRNLSHTGIRKVARGFGLKGQELDFFENLALMNQATSHEDRNHYYRKMIAVEGYKKAHKIAKESYEYFSKWYYPVIREIVTFGNGDLTAEEIASLLQPKITKNQAVTAINLLLKLKLIRKNSEGKWEQTSQDISTGPEVKSLVVANFHKEMMKLAAASIDNVPAQQRDIGAVTLSIDRKNLSELKSRVVAFRKELLAYAGGNEDPDRVVQINIQVFPLSK